MYRPSASARWQTDSVGEVCPLALYLASFWKSSRSQSTNPLIWFHTTTVTLGRDPPQSYTPYTHHTQKGQGRGDIRRFVCIIYAYVYLDGTAIQGRSAVL